VGSRLADELRRELAAAEIPSVSIFAGDAAWETTTADPGSRLRSIAEPLSVSEGVMVAPGDGRMIVFSLEPSSSKADLRFELRFDPKDRPARRRACLAVVEELRALGEPQPPSTAPERSEPRAPPEAGALGSNAPAPREVLSATSSDVRSAPRPRMMGAATMLDVDRRFGAPMVHAQFTGLTPIGERLAFRVQAMWPLTGTDLRLGSDDARVWTFGVAMGLQYALARGDATWRPFAGIGTGSQILLTDTPVSAAADAGRAPFVPSANLRVDAGLRLTLTQRVQLFADLEVTRDWLLQSSRVTDYGNSAANAVALHTSLGVLFDY
jgi:hypothetical protein